VILVAVGGVAGYLKAKSVPSLLAGLIVGSLYAYSSYVITEGNPATGFLIGAGTSTILFMAMGARFIKTKKPMPAGVAALGLAVGLYNAKKWSEWTHGV